MRITTDHSLQPGRLAALLAIALFAALIAIGYRAEPAAALNEGVFSFATASSQVTEGQTAYITVNRSGGTNLEQQITIGVSLGAGAAYADILGFGSPPGPYYLTFPDGLSSRTLDSLAPGSGMPTADDLANQGTRTITFSLSSVSGGGSVGVQNTHVLTILDNDGPPTYSFQQGTPYVFAEGSGAVSVPVYRNGATAGSDSVHCVVTLAGGSDQAEPADITGTNTNQLLTFPSGSTAAQNCVLQLPDDATPEATETLTLTLSSPSGGFSPGSFTVVLVNITDNDGAGTLAFTSATYTANESGGTASFGIARTGGSTGTVSATCSTTDLGSADPGFDYTAVPTQSVITWTDGQTFTQSCQVAILPDAAIEGPETFGISITGSVAGQTSAVVTIIDDDGTGTLQFSQATYSGAENGGAITVTVTRSGGSSGGVTVDIATSSSGSTATANVDYASDSTTLVFVDGDVSESWTVSPIDDLFVEGTEYFYVVLSNPTGGAVLGAQSSAQVTISDNESPLPQVSSIAPSSGTILGGTAVTISGINFTGATSVTFDGLPCTSLVVLLSTQITCVTPAHLAGVVQVVVTTPAGSSSTTGTANDFTYTGGPTITLLDPATGPSTGNTIVTVTGTNFTASGMTVRFDGVVAVHSYISSTSLVAVSPAHAAGTINVTVTTPGGTSPDTAADDFVYTGSGGPVVNALSPVSGPIGTTVIITGSGFTGASLVTFGGVAATFTVTSGTQITTSVPAGTPIGLVDVRVTTPLGTSTNTSSDNFTNTSTGSTVTFTLYFRFTLIVWTGTNNISALAALTGLESPDNPNTNNVASLVGAIWRFDPTTQSYKGYFPGTDNVPGANDFTTLTAGAAYFIALLNPGTVTWTTLGSN